jgi:hypothetical protein
VTIDLQVAQQTADDGDDGAKQDVVRVFQESGLAGAEEQPGKLCRDTVATNDGAKHQSVQLLSTLVICFAPTTVEQLGKAMVFVLTVCSDAQCHSAYK